MAKLLKECKAEFIRDTGTHSSLYRLPNGETFSHSHSLVGRAAMNAYRDLVKQLEK